MWQHRIRTLTVEANVQTGTKRNQLYRFVSARLSTLVASYLELC